MARLFCVFSLLFMVGFARAAEIADAPMPEPNYVGIVIFLVLTFGGGGWYMWKVMTGSKEQVKK